MRSAGPVSYNPAVRKLQRQERDQLLHISQLLANMGHPSGRKLRMRLMWKRLAVDALLCGVLVCVLAGAAWAQEAPSASGGTTSGTGATSGSSSSGASGQPKIQVNFLNTCRPAQGDLEAMGRALAEVKERPRFGADFEISRGVTTLSEAEARAVGAPEGSSATPSSWVRIRKEFPEKAVLTDAQYSLSVEGDSASEALALHLRDSREVLQILISDTVTGSAAQVVKAATPPDRIRIERFGKASIVLARCGGVDQSAYEPLFLTAGGILEKYRAAMSVETLVPAEMAHLTKRKPKAAGTNH